MLVYLHRLRDLGRPIPKHQFAFRKPIPCRVTMVEERDDVLNRYTRIAKMWDPSTGKLLDYPRLLDTQLVGLTNEYISLSGIERCVDVLGLTNDYAQTWLCMFNEHPQ